VNFIEFTDMFGIPKEYHPKPSSSFIPDWYKELNSYIGNEKKPVDGASLATAKRCMPLFDSIASGYIITTYCDIWINQEKILDDVRIGLDLKEIKSQPVYQWSTANPVEFHPIEQMPVHPDKGSHVLAYPKLMNPWSIKTPKGYSTLFVPPFHRESPFSILPGLVDTDKYFGPVNFPFVLKNADTFEGLIPAGTPIAQLIPIKRDSWQININDINSKEFQEVNLQTRLLRSKFFDRYKTLFRQTKEYR
jgi:hypothetical protein